MVNLKTGLKVSLISALFLAGSMTSSAQADHESHSILPYVAIGVFASMLHNSSPSYSYRYKKKRYGHSGHNGHGRRHGHGQYSQGGHGGGHYSSNYPRSYSNGGYRYKNKRH